MEELEFEEEVEPVPVVPIVEEASFLEKVSAYLKGRNLIDILEDINNGELRHKINRICTEQKTAHFRAVFLVVFPHSKYTRYIFVRRKRLLH